MQLNNLDTSYNFIILDNILQLRHLRQLRHKIHIKSIIEYLHIKPKLLER